MSAAANYSVILIAALLAFGVASCTGNKAPHEREESVAGAGKTIGTPTVNPLATFAPEDRKLLQTLLLDTEAEPEEGVAPLEVHFKVEADEKLVKPKYRWNFGDFSPLSTEASPVHVFQKPGLYTVLIEIDDEATGMSGKDDILVDVEEPWEEE